MSGRFTGLRSLQLEEETSPEAQGAALQGGDSAAAPGTLERPWEQAPSPAEPVKALNGRVPRSVRLAFDRQLTDAMETLGTDVTVDLAVEALARLVSEEPEVRERWLHKLWRLKHR